jgi:hypothetical protein
MRRLRAGPLFGNVARHRGIRADARELKGFIPSFREAIRKVNAYAPTKKSGHTAFFFVEGRIHKLVGILTSKCQI